MKSETIFGSPIRCYDNGGKTFDRYTVVYMNQKETRFNSFSSVGMSEYPFHPQGFGQHCAAMPGRHLGKRVPFVLLPVDCQKVVFRDIL